MNQSKAKPKIVVLGGGFAGLESLFYLKMKLGNQADLKLVTEQQKFLFKPNTIYIPFGEAPEKFEVDLVRPLAKQSIELVTTSVDGQSHDRLASYLFQRLHPVHDLRSAERA